MLNANLANVQNVSTGDISNTLPDGTAVWGQPVKINGLQAYGIDPPTTDEDRTNFGWHSDVERTLESSLYQFVEFVWGAVAQVAGSR